MDRQPATTRSHHQPALFVAALFLAGAGLAAWKAYEVRQAKEAFDAAANGPMLKMPEAAPAASMAEPPGILADKAHGEEDVSIAGKDTRLPDPASAVQGVQIANDVLPVLNEFSRDPSVLRFKRGAAADPELRGIIEQFQKDGDMEALTKGILNNVTFMNLYRKSMADPHFQELIRKAHSSPMAAAAQRGSAPPPKPFSLDIQPAPAPAAAQDADGSPAAEEQEQDDGPPPPVVDPGIMTGDASGRTAAPAPPAPKIR